MRSLEREKDYNKRDQVLYQDPGIYFYLSTSLVVLVTLLSYVIS